MNHIRLLGSISASRLVGGLLLLFAGAMPALAQYPEKPVRVIVPVAAGGPSDSMARVIAESLSQLMGKAVVVENRPGASGSIAAQFVLAAPADGYTILWAIGSMTANPLLQKNPPYQSLAQFTPISLVGRFVFGLFIHPDIAANTISDLVQHARANPDKLAFASNTLGEYMALTRLMQAADIRMLRVPYKGGSQSMPDMITGRVQVALTPVSLGLPYVKQGKLRLLATASARRTPLTPDVPTMAEEGYPAVSLPGWQALFGPPAMPKHIAERISIEVRASLQDPRVRAQLAPALLEPHGSTPAELSGTVAEDMDAWRRFIRENQIPQE